MDQVARSSSYRTTIYQWPHLSTAVFCFLPRGQAASLYPGSSGLEAAGRALSQQISQCRLEAPFRSSARAVGRPTASGKSLSSRPMAFHQQERQFRSDATVLADCALTMTTTTRDTYELHKRSFLSMSEWPTRKLHQHSPTYFDVFLLFFRIVLYISLKCVLVNCRTCAFV